MLGLQIDEIRESKSLFGVTDTDEELAIEKLRSPKSLFDKEPEPEQEEMGDVQEDASCGEPDKEKPLGFWKRQFQQEATKAQKRFDWMFGVVMPAVCFYFDPIV